MLGSDSRALLEVPRTAGPAGAEDRKVTLDVDLGKVATCRDRPSQTPETPTTTVTRRYLAFQPLRQSGEESGEDHLPSGEDRSADCDSAALCIA